MEIPTIQVIIPVIMAIITILILGGMDIHRGMIIRLGIRNLIGTTTAIIMAQAAC